MYQSYRSNRSSFRRPKPFGRPTFYTGSSTQRSFRRPRAQGPKQMVVRDINIFVKKATVSNQVQSYTPDFNFDQLDITPKLKANIAHKGYLSPTPIQNQALPPILVGRDLIGLANTGTGKTAAFLIPIINSITQDKTKRALIIAPTRELAQQINDEFRALAFQMGIYSTVVIGGANINRQIWELKRNPGVVIGTPGRLKDLIKQKALSLQSFSIFVLDEVDLMVDIGFIEDVKYFISQLPQNRQSLFFSATISPKVREILNSFVIDPVTVSVTRQDTSENVDQDVIRVNGGAKKIELLHDLLIKQEFKKVLIFGATKHGVEKLNTELLARGFKVGALHGDKTQGNRKRTLDSFKNDQIQVLLATDVASRGLDIPQVSHVINYDLPGSYEDYIHRIGRTGRANQKGIALTFVE